MSAYKTAIVRLGEAEYHRLRAAEEELRLQEFKKGERDSRSSLSIFDQILADSRSRADHYNQIVAEMDETAAQAAIQAERWVAELNRETEIRLVEVQQNAAVWVEQFAQHMQERQVELEKQLQRQAEASKKEQLAINQSQQADDQTERQEDALRWIEGGRNVLDYITQEYALDLLSANELELQRGDLNEAVRLYNLGKYALAWQAAHFAFNELGRLRHRLENERGMREHCHQALVQQAQDVYQRIADQQGVQAMDVEGLELAERIDTAFWTDGIYAELVEHSRQAVEIIAGISPNDLNEMAEWQGELALLAERGLELVTQARLAVLASQLRFNVAQIVVQALEGQGFFLENASYAQNDYRGAFVAQTRNLAGNEVMVTIDPDPGLDEGGRLSIISSDARYVTEHELRQRTREIYSAIQSYGVDVSGSDNLREFTQIQKRVEETKKPQHLYTTSGKPTRKNQS